MTEREVRRLIRAQRSIAAATLAALISVWVLWQLRDLAILVAFAVLLAYVLDPLVNALQRVPLPFGDRLPRAGASAIVMAVLVGLLIWIGSLAVPRLLAELTDFVATLPARLDELIRQIRGYSASHGLTRLIDPILDSARLNAGSAVQTLGGLSARWAGRLVGGVVELLALLVLPLLTFYLLSEREDVVKSVMTFVPAAAQPRMQLLRKAVDRALRSYVHGQAVVCIVMGTATGTALALLGFPAPLLLGVIVGLAEVVPYLGFIVAALSIAVAGIGLGVGPALIGVLTYAVINVVSSFIVSPRVMGRYLKLHPFVVTVSILAGGQLLGPAGALIALPTAAALQSVASEVVRARAARRRAARRDRPPPVHAPETD